jgi:hypothetical protein
MGARLEHFDVDSDPDVIQAALERDGAVIVEGLLSMDAVDRVNAEVEPAVAAADPNEEYFNPLLQAFHGQFTKQVSGMPGISPTFAVDVMCHPPLLALCDRILAPSCLGWLRTEENNYLSTPPEIAATLPRVAQALLGYAVHDGIPRGGGYLGMVRMQDPVELLARGEL